MAIFLPSRDHVQYANSAPSGEMEGGTRADLVLQRDAVQKLHGNERRTVTLGDFIDGADVGMVEGRCGLGFALKTGQGLSVFGYIIAQKLERDKAMQGDVFGLVDHAHPAASQLLDDAVV